MLPEKALVICDVIPRLKCDMRDLLPGSSVDRDHVWYWIISYSIFTHRFPISCL